MSETVYFVSDAHLGALRAERERPKLDRLRSFLDRMEGGDKTLYVVGDLFDFWFEYKSVIFSQHFEALHALRKVVDSGTRVVFIPGNHDCWAEKFLGEHVGLRVAPGPVHTILDGRHYFIAHGDRLRPAADDPADWLASSLLRGRLVRFLFRQIHPDHGVRLARAVSRWSRGNHVDGSRYADTLREDVAKPLFQQGVDAVILGHFHFPYHYRARGKELLVLGDWARHFTYAKVEGGALSLQRWHAEEKAPQVVRLPTGSPA